MNITIIGTGYVGLVTCTTLTHYVCSIGNNQLLELIGRIGAIEKALGKAASKYANVDDLVERFHYKPAMTVKNGIQRFVSCYPEFYGK